MFAPIEIRHCDIKVFSTDNQEVFKSSLNSKLCSTMLTSCRSMFSEIFKQLNTKYFATMSMIHAIFVSAYLSLPCLLRKNRARRRIRRRNCNVYQVSRIKCRMPLRTPAMHIHRPLSLRKLTRPHL